MLRLYLHCLPSSTLHPRYLPYHLSHINITALSLPFFYLLKILLLESTVLMNSQNMYLYIIYNIPPPPLSSGPGISVGIATGHGLDGPRIESRWGRDFPHPSRPALGPTQPPVQWVPGHSPGIKSGRNVTLTPHPLLVSWSRKSRAIPLLPLWTVWPLQSLSACTRVHFIFTRRTVLYNIYRENTLIFTYDISQYSVLNSPRNGV